MAAKGKSIQWDDEDLDAISQISEADIERAAALWRSKAKKPYKDILDAKPTNDAASR